MSHGRPATHNGRPHRPAPRDTAATPALRAAVRILLAAAARRRARQAAQEKPV